MVLNNTLEMLLKTVYKHDNALVWWRDIAEDSLEMNSFEIFDGLQLLSVFGAIELEGSSLKTINKVKLKRKGLNHLHYIDYIDDSDFSIIRSSYTD